MTRQADFISRWIKILTLGASMLLVTYSYAQPQEVTADNDPPARVGRMSYTSGEVSFSPAGNDEWQRATINRPIVTGDRLWADTNGRAELMVDNSTWWLGTETSVTVSNLDDRIVQLQVQQGTLDVRVRRVSAGNIVEIDTPNLAFSLTRPGRYRIDVDPQGGSTMVVVRDGMGEVYGENASYVVTSRQAYRFYGTDVTDSEFVDLPAVDPFERWALERDRRYDRVVSARYVSPDVVGYEDLDSYGTWSAVSAYGNVWFPRQVNTGWAPYREGHWSWIDPWGWTWVDDEPWGFAPFHYGRWAHFDRGWGWVPGPRNVRAVYAPALVAFVGGAGFGVAVSSGPTIGWFPLGPREVYVPAYRVSREYFRQVNVSNTVVNVTNVTNVYNNPTTLSSVSYVNRSAPNGVTAVPQTVFAQAQNVGRAAIPMSVAAIQRAEVRPLAPVAPARPALMGAAPVAQAKPPAAVMQRAVVAKAPPPPPPVPDAQKLPALARNPGQPLNRTELQTLRRAAPPPAVAAPAVKVVTPPKPAASAAPPARAAVAPGSRGSGGAGLPSPSGVPAPAAPVPSAGTPPRVGPESQRPPTSAVPPGMRPQRPAVEAPPTPVTPPVARPPDAGVARPGRGPESARTVPSQVRSTPETTAAPPAPSETRRALQRPSETSGPAPQPPQARPEAVRPPQRQPQQARPEAQRPPQAAPRAEPPQPPQPPQARPEPQRPPQGPPRAEPPHPPQPPQARPESPRPPQPPAAEARKGPGSKPPAKEEDSKDKKDQNP